MKKIIYFYTKYQFELVPTIFIVTGVLSFKFIQEYQWILFSIFAFLCSIFGILLIKTTLLACRKDNEYFEKHKEE